MRYVFNLTAVLLLAMTVGCSGEKAPKPTDAAKPAKAVAAAETWSQFRGPTGNGAAAKTAAPVTEIDPAKHILWRTPLEVSGNSSPIVWGDRVFLTGEGHRILAFDRRTGAMLWNTALTAPAPEPSEDGDPFEPGEYGTASATACTDGERVYAFFGTGVIGCVDFDGKQAWARRLVDRPENFFGLAASPIVIGDLVIQIVDQDADDSGDETAYRSFIVGLRASDGKPVWRTNRPVHGSWSTPLLTDGDRPILVTCATPWTIAYNPADGKEIWRAGELYGDVAASPIACGSTVYAFSDPSGPLLAVRLGGAGDVTETHVEWSFEEDLPDVASALCDGARLLYLSDSGILRCLDATTGSPLWQKDLPTMVYASPVLVGGKAILIDTDGRLMVIDPTNGEILHTAELGEAVNASPAAVGKFLYVRTAKALLCLGEK